MSAVAGVFLVILAIGFAGLACYAFSELFKGNRGEKKLGLTFGICFLALATGASAGSYHILSSTLDLGNRTVELEQVTIVNLRHSSTASDSSDNDDENRTTSLFTEISVDSYPDREFVVRGWPKWRVGQKITLEKQLYQGRWIDAKLSTAH